VERLRGRLSAAGDEVREVASQLAGRAALYLGPDDRKALLLEPSPAPILHIATHAMADTNAMEQSRIVFSPPARSDSGADYLFLKEAYDLPLKGLELAVLSACDTERGQLVRGEGVQSFSRAFIAAGARSAVSTLWRVADRPTAEFMGLFYHHLQQGLARDEALRQTKLSFATSGTALADPHYWAAFVLTGDALRPVPRAVRWLTILLPPGLVAAIASVLLARRRRTA
jgi:CHAT domain-containing protein